MKRFISWSAAVLALLLTLGLFGSIFFISITTGIVGAIQQCGIPVVSSEGASQPAGNETSPTASPSPTPTPVPTNTPPGAAARAYFDQFSQAVQVQQRRNAALIVTIGESRSDEFTYRDIQIAVAVAIQESDLQNLPYGDSDSLGLFQQRPSQGWGTATQLMDPVYAINGFYDALARVGDREGQSLIEIAITVQTPNREAYQSRWNWDKISEEIVTLYRSGEAGDPVNICLAATGISSGVWQSPLKNGSYCVYDHFGPRFHPIYKKWLNHSGIDLSCNGGDPIFAASAGRVDYAGWNGDLGIFVRIDHGGGVSTGYGHLNRLAPGIHEGQTVRAGQLIGYVGTTGGSTGNHLHFMVIVDGKPIDPEPFMRERGIVFE
jgi:hypothetical protein